MPGAIRKEKQKSNPGQEIVHEKIHGKRCEVLCDKVALEAFRSGGSTDNVLVLPRVYTNATKGAFMDKKDVQELIDAVQKALGDADSDDDGGRKGKGGAAKSCKTEADLALYIATKGSVRVTDESRIKMREADAGAVHHLAVDLVETLFDPTTDIGIALGKREKPKAARKSGGDRYPAASIERELKALKYHPKDAAPALASRAEAAEKIRVGSKTMPVQRSAALLKVKLHHPKNPRYAKTWEAVGAKDHPLAGAFAVVGEGASAVPVPEVEDNDPKGGWEAVEVDARVLVDPRVLKDVRALGLWSSESVVTEAYVAVGAKDIDFATAAMAPKARSAEGAVAKSCKFGPNEAVVSLLDAPTPVAPPAGDDADSDADAGGKGGKKKAKGGKKGGKAAKLAALAAGGDDSDDDAPPAKAAKKEKAKGGDGGASAAATKTVAKGDDDDDDGATARPGKGGKKKGKGGGMKAAVDESDSEEGDSALAKELAKIAAGDMDSDDDFKKGKGKKKKK